MKNMILFAFLILFNSCNAQKNNNIKNNKVKYYNTDQYKDWKVDSAYASSQSNNHKYLMKGNDRQEISTFEEHGVLLIKSSNIINPYCYYKYYSLKSKILVDESIEFYSSLTGISKEYDENGKLIKEKNWDTPYQFSIEDLIKKFKIEYNIDIENRKNVRNVYRAEHSKTLGIPIYHVVLKTEAENKWIEYLIDGNTGKTLYIMKSSEGDETDIIDEYLKSIGKFKDTPPKSNPATSKRLTPLPNEELGTSYAYGGAVPQNTHQIYEGKAYTKTEWETFEKSLPRWKKIL